MVPAIPRDDVSSSMVTPGGGMICRREGSPPRHRRTGLAATVDQIDDPSLLESSSKIWEGEMTEPADGKATDEKNGEERKHTAKKDKEERVCHRASEENFSKIPFYTPTHHLTLKISKQP